MRYIILVIVLIVAVNGVVWWYASTIDSDDSTTEITSFEECAEAGYPIMESYPEQCRTPDGQTFTRELTEEAVPRQTIQLYYYNPELDQDEAGNILCSAAGLVPVERAVVDTGTPIRDAITLLLQGELTAAEAQQGVTTEFPLAGLELTETDLEAGVLTLRFADPNNATSGGSCRVNILRSQIERTAQQFAAVTEVRLEPEEVFQP